MCHCRYHWLAEHPQKTYVPRAGLIDLMDLCWCECDHSADETRWAA